MSREVVPAAGRPTFAQRAWLGFCGLMARIFYRRLEASGARRLPLDGPVILCANHVNALADAVVVQSSYPRPAHPLARSGLFRNPLLRPILAFIQAVPIYRRRPADTLGEDGAATASRNEESFQRCFELLEEGRTLLIFPEGQSHSDPMLRPIKTGAARLALGLRRRTGRLPAVVPVGLIFTHKGRFRSDVLVQYGKPVVLREEDGEDEEATIRRYTADIEKGLQGVTLNLDSWEDLRLLRLLQSFFAFRRGRRRRQTLSLRIRALQRLIGTHRWLRLTRPDEVLLLSEKLNRFNRLCRRYGVKDYHLHLRYHPGRIAWFVARSLAFLLLVFPLALWGLIGSAVPYFATRQASRLAARGRDQYDTAGMLFGLLFFLFFWSLQTGGVYYFLGLRAAAIYALSLPITGAIALLVGRERLRILENVRVFLLFLRKRRLQDYLRLKRQELEVDLARIARVARRGLIQTDGG